MELVTSGSLARLLQTQSRLEVRRDLDIALQIADALTAVHRANILHRGIKPENVLLTEEGTPLLTDFGVELLAIHHDTLRELERQEALHGGFDIPIFLANQLASVRREIAKLNMPLGIQHQPTPDAAEPAALQQLAETHPESSAPVTPAITDQPEPGQQPTAPPATRPPTPLLPGDTVTFLFTDIEGSTELWERHMQAMPRALARHDQILRTAIADHAVHVFKTIGDAFCAAFARAADALGAALDAQRALQSEPWGDVGVIRVRMALHRGDVEPRDGDYFGPTVNRVARLLAAGYGGQILLSAAEELARDGLPDGAELRDLGQHQLKDLIRPEQIFQLVAANLPQEFPPLKTVNLRRTNLKEQPTPLIERAVEVCVLLDGLPLAIELAAARSRSFSPQSMRDRLIDATGHPSLQFLVGGSRDLPARHQTLRATIGWSYDLLSRPEQALFRRLTVFIGGRTHTAIAAVCDIDGDIPSIEEALTSLVDKSLLQPEVPASDLQRYMFLKTLDAYGQECLAASGETDLLRGRHVAYFLALAEEAEPELTGLQQEDWLSQLERNNENLRAALSWFSAQGEAQALARLAGALWRFWYTHGHLREGRDWLEKALALLAAAPAALDTHMDRSPENIQALAAFIATFCVKERLKPLDASGVARVLEHAIRMVEDQTKLSVHLGALADVIREAQF
jgi:class 3 adenylate cyclase